MNIINTLTASPRRAFWLGLVLVCLTTLVVVPLLKTSAASAPVTSNNSTAAGPGVGGSYANALHRLTNRPAYSLLEPELLVTVVTTNGGSGLAGTYPDLATAITALNAATITSPVVISVSGTETAPAGGYTITAQGTSTNTIVIDGTLATTITAGVGVSTTNDGIFKLIGSDFVTLQGFTMLESAGNVTTTTQVEWGVALLYATTTNGAQNCTIQNNTITLNRTNPNTFGIYSNSTHTAAAPTTSATATTATGGNENLKVYGNIISNVNIGIVHIGPTAAADQNITADIGGTTAPTGNSITDFGTTTTGLSSYANLSGTINGILVRNTKNFNISRNTINSSNGGVVVGTLNGIQIPAASNAPTGTLTQTINNNSISLRPGATGITVVGITMPSTSVNATTTNSINNNDFNTFGHTVAGATGSITFISQGGNPLVQNFNSNTFTNISVNTTGTITFFSFAPSMISTASMSLSSNQIVTGFTRTGVGSTTVWSSNASSVAGSVQANNNNNFSNITLTGASAFTGISNTDGGTPTKSVNGNTFSNITTGAGTVIPLNVNFSATGSTVNNNTITGITTGNSITALLLGSSNNSITVSGNIIDPITSGGASVIGISSASLVTTISKNKIYDLSGTVAGSVVEGLKITSAGTSSTATVSNNLIGNLTAPAATGSNAVIGISITGSATTSTFNVYFNTVYVNNTTSGAGFGSSGISTLASATSTLSTLNLRNNIIVNTSVQNGAGLTAAYRRSSGIAGTLANYASTSNNNDFFAGTPSATNVIYTDGTSTATTIAAYKAGVFTAGTIAPRDSASFTEAPTFLSTTGSSVDFLHINTVTPTQIESGGSAIAGITDDFDGQTRNVSTPDVGADEFTGTALDLTGPTISYVPAVGNTTLTTNRTVTITVVDPSGVPIAGAGLPVIYYRKGVAGAYASTQCSSTGGSNYSCVIDYTMVTGGSVTSGDVINYYVAAQDNAGNVAVNPSTGASGLTANPPAASTPPTAPGSYSIVAAFSGTKTVCASGCDFTTLTGAAGIFNAINTGVVTSNVVVQINGDLVVGEDGSVALNPITEEPSGSNFTVRIFPTGAARLITSTTAPAGGFIRLNAADRVTIDGSIGGTGTDRSLTITEANTGTTSAVVWLQNNGTDGATSNTIKNLNIVGQGTATTLIGIGMGATGTSSVSTTSLGTNNNTNTIQNNNISKVQFGIYTQGASAAGKNTGNVITQNVMNTVSPNNVAKGGIITGFENNLTITRNVVSEIAQAGSPDVFGVSLGIQGISTSTFTGNEVTNATVSRNNVGSIRNTGTFSACGICVAPATSGTNLISNNMISGVSANGTSGDFSVGLLAGGGTGSTTQIYNNSISMTGTQTGGSDKSMGLMIASGDPIMDVRNNAILNTQNNGTGANYAIVDGSSTFVNLTSNFNDLFTTTGALYFVGGTASTSAPTGQVTLANWTTATGRDTPNSISSNPNFISLTDLHITGAPLVDAGQTIAAVTNDIDGTTRPQGSAYDIGAHEVIAAPGVLQFSSAGFSGAEGGNVVLTVSRTLGSSGTVGATITLTDGSGVGGAACTAGVDYINPGPQLISLGDTVTSTTLNVAACTDAGFDPGETFTAALSAPTGGATLGAQTTTTGTIIDVAPAFSGNVNVGTGQNYTSLTNPGGIFEALNNSGVSGNVTVTITSDLTVETGTVALNAFASPFTVTVVPSAPARIVSGAAASTALIRTNGASRFTIDGSVNGGGTDRSLTITNTSTTAPQVVRFGSIGTTPITNDTLKNCIIVNGVNTSSAITLLDTGAVTAGYFNNIAIQNNDVQKAFIGVFTNAIVLAGNGSGLLITQNKFDNTGANAIRLVGVYVQGADGATVSNNTVGNFNAADGENDTGIWLATGTVNTTVSGNSVTALGYTGTSTFGPYGIRDSGGAAASGNNITANSVSNITSNGTLTTGPTVFGIENSSGGTIIQRNNVQGVISTNTGTYGASGINITSGNNVVIKNNFVSNVTGDMTGGAAFSTTFGLFGIRIATGTGHQIYHNSVNMYGLRTGTANSSLLTAAIGIVTTASTGMDIRNNIFANNITGGTTSIANVSAYLPSGGTSAMNLTWNNNAYYYGTDTARQGTGQAGTTAGTNFYLSVGAMAAYSSTLSPAGTNDNGSFNFTTAVPFVTNNDLHVLETAALVLGNGAAIGSVTNDFDLDPRPVSAPDIGADEVVQSSGGSFPSGTFYNAAGGTGDLLAGNVTITNRLTLTGQLNAGANTLTINCGATIVGASATNYILGNLQEMICAAGPFDWPVGTANGYSPVHADVTAFGGGSNSLAVKAVQNYYGGAGETPALNPNSLQRYWDLNKTGTLTANIKWTFLPGDVVGAGLPYTIVRINGTSAASFQNAGDCGTNPVASPCVDVANNFMYLANVSTFSKWTGGPPLAPTATGAGISGRVTTADGRGITNARVFLSGGGLTEPIMVQTGQLGLYQFEGLVIGRSYIVSVQSQRFTFAESTRLYELNANVTNADFVAEPQQ